MLPGGDWRGSDTTLEGGHDSGRAGYRAPGVGQKAAGEICWWRHVLMCDHLMSHHGVFAVSGAGSDPSPGEVCLHASVYAHVCIIANLFCWSYQHACSGWTVAVCRKALPRQATREWPLLLLRFSWPRTLNRHAQGAAGVYIIMMIML